MSVELFERAAEDAEEIIVAWLTPLRRTATARLAGDPLPFTLVTDLGGTEDATLQIGTWLVSIHTLCDKAQGWGAAKDEASLTHRRMLALSSSRGPITLKDGRQASVDFVSVFQPQIWVLYDDTQILRKVGRYNVGLSYVPAT